MMVAFEGTGKNGETIRSYLSYRENRFKVLNGERLVCVSGWGLGWGKGVTSWVSGGRG